MAEEQGPCSIVTRVGSYPAVASAISQASDLYGRVKESYPVVKYTLESAETVTTKVSEKTLPIVTHTLGEKIDTLNTIACSQLDKLEEKYPIVTKPTNEVLDETKKVYESTLKPTVDKLSSVAQYGVDAVNGVTTYTTTKVGTMKDYGVESAISIRDYGVEKINQSLQTPIGQKVAVKLDSALSAVDNMVDYYLPAANGEVNGTTSEDGNTVSHAVNVSNKLKNRLFERTTTDLENLRKKTSETLEKFNVTMDLMNYYTQYANLAGAGLETTKQKFMKIYEEIMKPELETELKRDSLESLIIIAGRLLTEQLQHGLQMGKESTEGIPEKVKVALEQSRKYAEQMYNSFIKAERLDEFTKKVMTDFQTATGYLRSTVGELSQLITARLAAQEAKSQTVEPEAQVTDEN